MSKLKNYFLDKNIPLMCKKISFKSFLLYLVAFYFCFVPPVTGKEMLLYDFDFKTIEGRELPLSTFKGKVVLIVNTASLCGFTRQYKGLQEIWKRYKSKGLIVLGVPTNDFGGQEPKSNGEIKNFCDVSYNVNFPLTEKIHVKGNNAHPFYKWAEKELGALSKPRWNFHKFLISPDGRIVDWFSTPTSPTSKKIIKAIEKQLSLI